MQINVKSLFLAVSLFLNAVFILIFALASSSKNSLISVYASTGHTAAAVVSTPSGSVSFGLIEITLAPREKAFLQYSIFSERKQGNLIINALYDPTIVSVKTTSFGIEITALAEGSVLMQVLSNEGIKDIALITVEK